MALFDTNAEQRERRSSIGRWQIVRATFETANQDVIIRHSLPTPDPEQVSYQVLNLTGPAVIYHDGSATRSPWGNGFIRLRANIVTVTADILLTVTAANIGTTKLPAGVSTTPSTNADTLDGLDSTAFARANASFVTTSAEAGLTNESVLTAGTGISIVGATISATGAGSAPSGEAFVTIGNSGNLSAERALAVGTGLTLTDGGANSSATIASTTQRIRKTADESVTSSTVLQSDDALNPAIAASEVLAIEWTLFYDGDVAGDLKIAVNVPAGATGFLGVTGLDSGALSIIGSVNSGTTTDLTDTGTLVLGTVGTGTYALATVKAYIANSTTPGTVTLRWAQNTSSLTATRIKAGSFLIAHRLA